MKNILSSIRKSLSAKLSIWVVSFAAIVFVAALIFNFFQARKSVSQEAFSGAQQALDKTILRTNDILQSVEMTANNLEWLVYRHLDSPDAMLEYSRTTLQGNTLLGGCSIAFEPYYFKGREYFSAYSSNTDGLIETTQEGGDNYQYFYLDWYLLPKLLNQPCWTEPYCDWEEDDDYTLQTQMMISYCKPLNALDGSFIGCLALDLSLQQLSDIISAAKPYPHSYNILVSRGGSFLVHPDKERLFYQTVFTEGLREPNPKLDKLGQAMIQGESGMEKIMMDGQKCYVFYAPLKSTGWSVGIVCPESDIFDNYAHMRNMAIAIVLLGLLLMFWTCYYVIKRTMKPLRTLTEQAGKIAGGHFEDTLPQVNRIDEIGLLSQSFSDMQQSLVKYIDELTRTTARNERIAGELQIARDIQMGMVPRNFPPFPDRKDIDLAVYMQPAREVGGDFYDYFIQDEQLYFCIGDVSGKGVPASLLMTVAVNLFRVCGRQGLAPERIASQINDQLAPDNDQMMFFTMFIGRVDLTDGSLSYCNCGHNPPYLLREGERMCRALPCRSNVPIGVVPGFAFEGERIPDLNGTPLLLYTDGLNEAENPAHETFGYERFEARLRRKPFRSAAQTVQELQEAIFEFVGDAPASDDLTLLCLRILI